MATALASVPMWLYYPTLVFALAWIVLRVAFNREEGQKRAVLARSCTQMMKQVEAKLHRVLLKQDPMAGLNGLVDEQIAPTVDRNIQENAWPWAGPAPDIDQEVEKQLVRLCSKFESNWTPVDPTGIRN